MTKASDIQFTIPELEAGSPEISMAPLIDVVFLLLIFFMVATVFPENRGLIIEKPESVYSDPLVMKKIVFNVDKEGKVFFQEKNIEIKDVQRLVKEQLDTAPDTAVLMHIDKDTRTGIFINVMDACKQGGAKNVGIATNDSSRTTKS